VSTGLRCFQRSVNWTEAETMASTWPLPKAVVAAEGLSLDPDPVSVISRIEVGLPVASAFQPSARLG
jgi:hypothetical protein